MAHLYKYEFTDFLFQVLRLTVLYFICYWMYLKLIEVDLEEEDVQMESWKSVTLSIFLGGVAYALMMRAFNLVMYYGFDCEALGELDQVFLHENPDNCHIIVGAAFFEKFDFITMKNHIMSKVENLHKCRAKLVKKFGLYYFQKMGPAEWSEK